MVAWLVGVRGGGALGGARGRVRAERVAVEATDQEISEAVVTAAEATGRVIREREEAEATGQAKAEAEATGEVGPLRLPTCFARLLLQGASAVFDWLALVGARSVRGGAYCTERLLAGWLRFRPNID